MSCTTAANIPDQLTERYYSGDGSHLIDPLGPGQGYLAQIPLLSQLYSDGGFGPLDFEQAGDIWFHRSGGIIPAGDPDHFGVVWFGTMTVGGASPLPVGDITLGTASDDGSVIWVDGQLVVDNNGYHSRTTRTATVSLAAGEYEIVIGWFEGTGSANMEAKFSPGLVPNYNNLTFINPSDPSQAGIWSAIEFMLLTPNDGEKLTMGSRCLIIWQTHKTISNVFIEYSTDNGDTWTQVDPPNTGNTGSYDWMVPEVSSNHCRVRISDASDPGVIDKSDTVFSIIPRALVAHWKLDETVGNTATDSSGYAHHGTLYGNPKWLPSGGQIDGALEFDGLDDYVLISNEENFDITHTITLAAWIKVNAFDKAWQAIVTKGDNAWRLQRDASKNGIEFACTGLNVQGTTWGNVLGSVDVNDGQWHHIAGVYDGTKIYLYVDGVVDDFNDAAGFINKNNYPVMIGENAQERGRYWNGLIDDVRIYNYGLSASEISLLYKQEMFYYVDKDATGANNGSSWGDAFNYLQDALNVALWGNEIWVAEGTYKPDEGGGKTAGDQTATFQLINGVAIKGGYGGFGEPNPNARDIKIYETTLSGDIGTFGDNSDNSYHVVTGSGTNETAVLDGFTITAGNANGSWPYECGGGMYNFDSSSPTVTNCKFIGNKAKGYGGGIHNELDSSPTFVNCHLSGNSAYAGGGICNQNRTSPTLINCCISGNSAYSQGGGMRNYNECSPAVTNCIFSGNMADYGGGIYNRYSSNPALTNCTFSRNNATQAGGAMANENTSSPTVTNCILWSNIGGEIFDDGTSITTITYSDVQGGWSGTGNIDADPCFVYAAGGDLRLLYDSPCVDAGNNSEPNLPLVDLYGHPRIIDGDCDDSTVVDMGAYEFNYAFMGDLDYNCRVDFFDFSISARYWMTDDSFVDIAPPGGDGIVDFKEVAIIADNWLAGTEPEL